MPDGNDDYRVVIDEDSLNWCGRSDDEVQRLVRAFADVLEPLADGRQVALMRNAWSAECWEGVTLVDIAYTSDRRVPRDRRVWLARLLDKCRTLEPQEQDIPQQVNYGGHVEEPSWGMTHAWTHAVAGRAMACLIVTIEPTLAGWTVVDRMVDGATAHLHFLSEASQLREFWRGVFKYEAVPEERFFVLAEQAFPGLIFAEDLRFRRFAGSYGDVLPWIIQLFTALDDHFAAALERHRGDQNKVMAEMSTYHVDISPESPGTRKNARAWAQRLVTYRGVEYRCDWHGKRLWNLDRVHFSRPLAEQENRILIGIFTDHLDT
ncbi:hypothetical protein [Streptomyces sp. AK04-3B]|uniref:hypothetical protein n=1 Tax=Streptomyces sp. AK04-3B TaxID=3028650 RepID=UPI0029A086E8|nr:hypothetical protein [Streptomyces sp. AK04-3B]MDX3802309.1 hypothetical protein [Streptomyces sp. AK04-3B]